MPGLSYISGGSVSSLAPQLAQPSGNADTIVNSLAPFPNASVRAAVQAAASTGNIPDYREPSCYGAGIQGSDYVGSVGKVVATSIFKKIPILGSVIGGVIGAFGAHHAAAVKQEQAILCAEVPGIQQFLRSVDVAITEGGDPQAAMQALDSAYAAFESRTAPIFKQCNAACDYRKYVKAAMEYRKQNYALMTARNSSGAQNIIGGVVSAVNALGSAFSPSAPSNTGGLALAGLTPARQGTMAGLLLVGGLLAAVLFVNLLGGKRSEN